MGSVKVVKSTEAVAGAWSSTDSTHRTVMWKILISFTPIAVAGHRLPLSPVLQLMQLILAFRREGMGT
jgi:hypothetical protein